MSRHSASVVLIALSLVVSGGEVIQAQQSTIGSRFSRGGSSFSSGTRVGFGFNSGRAGGGFSLRGGGRSGLGISGGQRSGRRVGSAATSVTVLDGHSGFFAAGVIRPWVTGLVPIVGSQPSVGQVVGRLPQRQSPSSPVHERLARLEMEQNTPPRSSAPRRSQAISPGPLLLLGNRDARDRDARDTGRRLDEAESSSATQPAAGLAEIRAHKAARAEALRGRVADDYDRGVQAQRAGKLALAHNYYRLADREAAEPIRGQIAERLAEIAHPSGK